MPKKPIDYSKNINYTIRSGKSIYVGSTTHFVNRKNQHKCHIYNENDDKYNLKLYKTIRENNGIWDMQPYSKYPCDDIVEQKIEEERIRQLLKADLNMCSCGTGLNYSELGDEEYHKQYSKQYRTENKDKISEYKKQYRTENKDKISEYKKQHYIQNKDEIAEYKKKYRTENKDKLSEYKKQHYMDNKDKIAEQMNQKVTCECGCISTRGNLTRHKKSKKHMKLMENK